MEKSQEIDKLAAALVKFQSEAKDAPRTGTSYNGKYANLEGIYSIIRPLLSKHGICFKQDIVSQSPEVIKVQTMLIHESGQYMSTELTVAVQAAKGNTNSLQQVGVSASYAKRYAILGAVAITQKDAIEDDDGDSFSDDKPKFPQAKKTDKPIEKPVTITHDLALELLELIAKAGYTEQKIQEHYGVSKLLDLTMGAYNNCKEIMLKKISEKKEYKNDNP